MEKDHEEKQNFADELLALKQAMDDLKADNERLTKTTAHQKKKTAQLESKLQKGQLQLKSSELSLSMHSNDDVLASLTEHGETTIVRKDEIETLNANTDAYSFLYCAPLCSMPMQIGTVVVILQFSLFLLFFADLLDTQSLPPDVGILVRCTQFICILVCFLAQTDIRNALRALLHFEGTEVFRKRFIGFSVAKFVFANCVMLIQGMLSVIVVIALIIYSDNVFDLLLNFTAVIFVSELDEVTFQMAVLGYAGRRTEKLAKRIQRTTFEQSAVTGCKKYLHIYIFFALLLAGYGFLFGIIEKQSSDELLARYLKVEFGGKNGNEFVVLLKSISQYRSACYRQS